MTEQGRHSWTRAESLLAKVSFQNDGQRRPVVDVQRERQVCGESRGQDTEPVEVGGLDVSAAQGDWNEPQTSRRHPSGMLTGRSRGHGVTGTVVVWVSAWPRSSTPVTVRVSVAGWPPTAVS